MASPVSDDIVVFSVLTKSVCSDCGAEIGVGDFLRLENEKPLCLACAELDHLVFLPSGDAALSRRSKKGSTVSAVILKFSRARKRYERQGILVESAALDAAEEACAGDAESRAAARAKAEVRRVKEDAAYLEGFGQAIAARYPKCPTDEAKAIANHACQKYSGRVGRTADAKAFGEDAVDLAVRAHIRHEHTPYDKLLLSGVDRRDARERIAKQLDSVGAKWRLKG